MSTAHIAIAKPAARRLRKPAAAAEKTYLYAIIADGQDRVYEEFGIDRHRLYTISAGPIAAVVSDVADDNVRPERARLAAHHEVLKRLMAETTPPAHVLWSDCGQPGRSSQDALSQPASPPRSTPARCQ